MISIDIASTAIASTGSPELSDGRCHATPPKMARVGHPVGDGVEEGAAGTGLAAVPGDRTVEDVGKAGEDEADDAEEQVAVRDQQPGADGDDEADDRQAVGGDTRAVQAPTDRVETPLDLGAPASVEHAWAGPFTR